MLVKFYSSFSDHLNVLLSLARDYYINIGVTLS